MKNLIKLDDVNNKIVTIRNENVILDSDVAELYGVQTKEVNQAVKNNPDKFPEGFVFELTDLEASRSRSKFLTLNEGRGSNLKYRPKAFTEQGLYMLATILKSPQATQTTLAIVTTFARIREFSRNIAFLNSVDPEVIEPEVIESAVKKTGGLLNEIFFSGVPTSAETSVEFNFGFMKGKRTVKSEASPAIQDEIEVLKKRIEHLERR